MKVKGGNASVLGRLTSSKQEFDFCKQIEPNPDQRGACRWEFESGGFSIFGLENGLPGTRKCDIASVDGDAISLVGND